jgi:hypothetical protein
MTSLDGVSCTACQWLAAPTIDPLNLAPIQNYGGEIPADGAGMYGGTP